MQYQNKYSRAICALLIGNAASLFDQWTIADWDQFAAECSKANILPALQARDSPLLFHAPTPIQQLLSTAHELNVLRNRTALEQIRECTEALNAAGIQSVALKGLAYLLTGIYPDIGCRFVADLDLLVPSRDIPAAAAIFRRLGYKTDTTQPLEFYIGHAYPPLRKAGRVEIDLHRTLGLGICPTFLPASQIFESASVISLDSVSILIPCARHLIFHHVMHSQMHDIYRERVFPSTRTLYDFLLLWRRFGAELNWAEVENKFRSEGQYSTFVLYLLQVQRSLGLMPPVRLKLTTILRLRDLRRQLLQRCPLLRFIDPSYYFFAAFQPRSRRLREILSQPGGARYLLRKFYQPEFYARLLADFR